MKTNLENFAIKATKWVGSIWSIITHTLIFIFFFILIYIGFDAEKVMLILTTLVSLEAIYLSLFIQMTVNKHSDSIAGIEEDIDDIQEDVEDIQEDVDDIQEDVEDIQEDIEDIQEDIEDISSDEEDDEKIRQKEEELKELKEEALEKRSRREKDIEENK